MKNFKEKVTEVGTGGSPDPLFRRMVVRMGGRGKAISSGSHIVIPVPFVVQKQSNQPQKAQKTQK